MNHLLEKHSFSSGDKVFVFNRFSPEIKYGGVIHRIVSLPCNKVYQIDVDHFYVTFPKEIYYILLGRGHNIIYNGRPEVVGDILRNNGIIEKINIQYPFCMEEAEIKTENINSMLVWRDGYCIEPR